MAEADLYALHNVNVAQVSDEPVEEEETESNSRTVLILVIAIVAMLLILASSPS